jgi:hypothetical protein
MEKENLDKQEANGVKPDVKFQLPSEKLKKIFLEIMEYQMDNFQIARATKQYKLAEEGFHIIVNFENDVKRGN